jgi:K+-sensing histidine kinase KdpD
MADKPDPHALLLQVMAHDLLAPLTAIKWQSELLARSKLDDAKHAEYVQSIRRSAELGITLSKHAHVAARVLGSSYEGTQESIQLHEVFRTSAEALKEQYARHGLSLTVDVHNEGRERSVDRELMGFLVWLMAKYFLTCTSAGATVAIKGEQTTHNGKTEYAFSMRSSGVEGAGYRAESFYDEEAHTTLDQTFVFSYLLRRVAPLVPCDIRVSAEQKELVVRAIL